MRSQRFISLCFAVFALFLLSGCATRSTHHATSVVQYLYPRNSTIVERQTIPHLLLPLRIAIAFVPDDHLGRRNALDEKAKMDLMKRVSSEFKKYPFVKSIEVIPSAYLTRGGSFTNLDQIRTMYGVDVIALLSYDQVQHTDQGLLSLSYWTLVGAYVVRGEKNDTSTMLDAAVYHIPSRKLLFRAPGTSTVKRSATPVNLSEQLRNDARRGFDQAAEMLEKNLQQELAQFRERVKESPQDYRIEHRPGYTGGGSLNLISFGIVAILGGSILWNGGKRRK